MGKDDFQMKNEVPDFGKKGPQYGNWIPYTLVLAGLAVILDDGRPRTRRR